jgi:hypothetical protein
MSYTDMGIVGATTDTFILFENGVGRNRLGLPGLSNAADHMPSKPDPPTAPVENLIWLAVDRESGGEGSFSGSLVGRLSIYCGRGHRSRQGFGHCGSK